MIEVKDLKVGFGKKEILHSVNITIPKNKIVAIVGQSGCGKTTFLKSLNRIIEEEGGYIEGQVLVGGIDYKEISKEMLRGKIGMVFQQPIAFPGTVENNLSYVLKYYGVRDREQRAKEVENCLKKAKLYEELQTQLKMSARKLSGGQKQRLAIARSLCAKPEILLLDEPCSALDMKNTIAIEETLLELKEQYTQVVVTHNLAQAKRIADIIVYMDQGKVLEITPKDLFFKRPSSEQAREQIAYI